MPLLAENILRDVSFNLTIRNVMTNVQNPRNMTLFTALLTALRAKRTGSDTSRGKVRAAISRWALLAAILVTSAPSALAQGSLFGGQPSGSASQILSINNNGLGFAVRGGHVAGDVVGREQSASHFGVSPYVNMGPGVVMGDLRFVYGNNGEVAWSFGTGYRHYVQSWDAVLGGNLYYDQDELTGAHFKQYGFGLELLSHRWEARGNFYRPNGDRSTQTGSRVDAGSQMFVGNELQFNRIDTFAEALRGFDAEVGFLLPGDFAERFKVRAFGGGYAYEGVGIDRFAGFSTRLQADIGNWLELGLKLSDDEIFSTNVAFNATVHFGGFYSQEHTRRSSIQRMAEPVRRNLNVAAATSDVTVPGQVATVGGVPLNIVHVNSNAAPGGTGTVEDPFDQLSLGLGTPADIVFVHAGSTFDAPPDNVVNLADDQSLFGEGLIGFGAESRKVVNTINVDGIGELQLADSPTFAANLALLGPDPFGPLASNAAIDPILLRPTLTGAAGDGLTFGNNSRAGGLIISGATGHGVVIDGVTGASLRDTLIENVGGTGILVQNTISTSSTTILDTIISNAAGPAFHVNGGGGNIGFNSTSTDLDPSFGAIVNSSQEAVLIQNRTDGSVNMFGTTIDDDGGAGILIENTVGNVTIDNARILNSTSTGISVVNSEGNFSFRNSIRPGTVIDGATGDSVNIDGLQAGSTVTFQQLDITNRLAGGINIDNLAGEFVFTEDLALGAPGAGAAVAPAISVDGSQATGLVRFGGNVTINGSTGRGIELINNVVGSSFAINGLASVTGAAGESIFIENNAGISTFSGGTTISERGAEGIVINNSTGGVSFTNGASVLNENLVANTAVQVTNSESFVLFDNLIVADAQAGGGIFLQDNLVGASGPGEFVAQDITVTSFNGVGLFGNNVTGIRVDDGTIVTNDAAAVDIENAGINITLESVTSLNSPDFGIRLVETNMPSRRTFTVTGDQTVVGIGTGGRIADAAVAGVNLQNAGQISLTSMVLDNNNYGIFVRNSGLDDDDDQFLDIQASQILESDVRGIDAENLVFLNIEDSIFTDNGDALVGGADPLGNVIADRETIFFNVTERLNNIDTTLFSQFSNPYTANIQRSSFISDNDDVIEFRNTALAQGAHLDVNLTDSSFIMNEGFNNDEAALSIDWDGVVLASAFNNTITMNGVFLTEDQRGFEIINDSFTDETLISLTSNVIPSSSQVESIGATITTNAQSTILIENNSFTFNAEDSIGLLFDLGPNANVAILNNDLVFLNDGGTGMLFTVVEQPSLFTISGNNIGLTDLAIGTNETGILFQTVIGTPNLQGVLNNQIILLNPGFIGGGGGFLGTPTNINIDFQIPRANGQILINGALRP